MRQATISLRAERIIQGKINQGSVRLVVVVIIMGGIVDFHLLALKLALNSFAIRRVANERQDGSYALDELCEGIGETFK
jgi:hypothetical protein